MLCLDFEQATQRLLQHLKSEAPRVMVALAGLPGSGKSTLAARLKEAVNQVEPGALIVLGMDGFHLTKAQLQRFPNPQQAFARRGAPWTFDVKALSQRLQLVREMSKREAVAWPDFQHEIGDPIEGAHTVLPNARLILVEGLYLLRREDEWESVGKLFDERWYLDTPLEVALERLTQRHMNAWGLTRAQAETRIAANDRLNAEAVWQDRIFADWNIIA